MKVLSQNIEHFLEKDYSNFYNILFYGPDSGLVQERYNGIVNKLVHSSSAIFNKIHFKYQDVLSDLEILINEMASLSFVGGIKVIILDNVDSNFSPGLQDLILHNKSNILLLKAGDLSSTSKTRKFFESQAECAAIPCYVDDSSSTQGIIRNFFKQHNFMLPDRSVIEDIAHIIQGDRMSIMSELEKVALYYKDLPKDERVNVEELYSVLFSKTILVDIEVLFEHIVLKNRQMILRISKNIMLTGEHKVTILRVLSSSMIKLLKAKTITVRDKASVDQVLRGFSPPIFFKYLSVYKHALQNSSLIQILTMLEKLIKLESLCKTVEIENEVFINALLDLVE